MKPSDTIRVMAPNVMIGDQVIVLVEPDRNNGSAFAPGIVTRVFQGGVINARLFRDLPGEMELATSLQLFDTYTDAATAQEDFKSKVRQTNKLGDDVAVSLQHPIAAFPRPGSSAPATHDASTTSALSAPAVTEPPAPPEPERTPPPAEVVPTFG